MQSYQFSTIIFKILNNSYKNYSKIIHGSSSGHLDDSLQKNSIQNSLKSFFFSFPLSLISFYTLTFSPSMQLQIFLLLILKSLPIFLLIIFNSPTRQCSPRVLCMCLQMCTFETFSHNERLFICQNCME